MRFTHCTATIYEKLGQKEKAEEQYRKLIELNPDNLSYYGNLMFLKGIDFGESGPGKIFKAEFSIALLNYFHTDSTIPEDLLPKTLTIMDGFAESYPRASAPKRLILDIVNGELTGFLRFRWIIER
jgi:peptide alpha-N-acetyltransferase